MIVIIITRRAHFARNHKVSVGMWLGGKTLRLPPCEILSTMYEYWRKPRYQILRRVIEPIWTVDAGCRRTLFFYVFFVYHRSQDEKKTRSHGSPAIRLGSAGIRGCDVRSQRAYIIYSGLKLQRWRSSARSVRVRVRPTKSSTARTRHCTR